MLENHFFAKFRGYSLKKFPIFREPKIINIQVWRVLKNKKLTDTDTINIYSSSPKTQYTSPYFKTL